MKNKTLLFVIIVLGVAFLFQNFKCVNTKFQDGDIIFQTSKSAQSQMLKLVTKSNLTHCGIIFHKGNELYVCEAVQPVKITPLKEWINRGEGSKYCVSRLKQPLTDKQKKNMFVFAKNQIGKNYDLKFEWSSSKMYCSELVWKIYNSVGYKLCEPKKFKNFDLTSKLAKKTIKQRFGTSINLDEKVVAPIDIFQSEKTKVIFSNY